MRRSFTVIVVSTLIYLAGQLPQRTASHASSAVPSSDASGAVLSSQALPSVPEFEDPDSMPDSDGSISAPARQQTEAPERLVVFEIFGNAT